MGKKKAAQSKKQKGAKKTGKSNQSVQEFHKKRAMKPVAQPGLCCCCVVCEQEWSPANKVPSIYCTSCFQEYQPFDEPELDAVFQEGLDLLKSPELNSKIPPVQISARATNMVALGLRKVEELDTEYLLEKAKILHRAAAATPKPRKDMPDEEWEDHLWKSFVPVTELLAVANTQHGNHSDAAKLLRKLLETMPYDEEVEADPERSNKLGVSHWLLSQEMLGKEFSRAVNTCAVVWKEMCRHNIEKSEGGIRLLNTWSSALLQNEDYDTAEDKIFESLDLFREVFELSGESMEVGESDMRDVFRTYGRQSLQTIFYRNYLENLVKANTGMEEFQEVLETQKLINLHDSLEKGQDPAAQWDCVVL